MISGSQGPDRFNRPGILRFHVRKHIFLMIAVVNVFFKQPFIIAEAINILPEGKRHAGNFIRFRYICVISGKIKIYGREYRGCGSSCSKNMPFFI